MIWAVGQKGVWKAFESERWGIDEQLKMAQANPVGGHWGYSVTSGSRAYKVGEVRRGHSGVTG